MNLLTGMFSDKRNFLSHKKVNFVIIIVNYDIRNCFMLCKDVNESS